MKSTIAHKAACSRRTALSAAAASLLLLTTSLWTAQAQAQAATPYPVRPVQLVVPTTVGGGADSLARLFAQKLAEATGQGVIVSNLPGAGGVIGMKTVAAAKADGYTVLFGFNQVTTMNPSLLGNPGYDMDKEFAPVALLAEQPYVWIANTAFPPNTVPEWIAYAKANPGKVAVGHNGTGSAANLMAEMFMQSTGTQVLGVAYKNNATPDLLAGVIQLKLEPASIALPLVQAGKVKALAVTSAARLPALPAVPTMSEFFPGNVMSAQYSVWVPAGTPAPVIDKLHAEFARIVTQPAMAAQLAQMSVRPVTASPAELRNVTRKETLLLTTLVKSRNIRVEQ